MVDPQVSPRYRGHCRPGTGAASRNCQPGTGVTVSSMNRVRTNSVALERSRRLISGLEHAGLGAKEGLVVLSSDGGVEHVTDRAADLIGEFFAVPAPRPRGVCLRKA